MCRLQSGISMLTENSRTEREFFEAIQICDLSAISSFKNDEARSASLFLVENWDFFKRCARAAAATSSHEVVINVMEIFLENSARPLEVGEIFALEAVAHGKRNLVSHILDFWLIHRNSFRVAPQLDAINSFSVHGSTSRKGKYRETLRLLESTIYCATVDRQVEVLQDMLQWHEDHVELVGTSAKLNADCIIHATLEDDKDAVKLLYSFGYRLGPDTDRRINKDYLKRIKLFRARAAPVYNIVAFEESQRSGDPLEHDPLKKSFEYARMARGYASKIQDFTKEYTDIAQKCEDFAKSLLDRCTTKHEVQTLLQTRSYHGHTDANFNVAILDGHKEFVAHEKFQQLLHKKWGQRDRIQWKNTPSYNIFWSEMNSWAKAVHVVKQALICPFLPLIVLAASIWSGSEPQANLNSAQGSLSTNPLPSSSTDCSSSSTCSVCEWFFRQSQIPVNRFLYWEMSKLTFYAIVLITMVDEDEFTWHDMLAACWIISYLLENFRTIHRLYRYTGGGGSSGVRRIFKRWLTFRNIYVLATDLVFLISLILRCYAHYNHQCRKNCPYEGNETAFVAAAIWSIAALLTFLRSIQGGLMWRQTGPVIISMSYMILDVMVFVFIFLIVYISFTLSLVYVYAVYSDDRTFHFNSNKSAFKLMFWAMIRTGNPQFADIRVSNNTTATYYDIACLQGALNETMETKTSLQLGDLAFCAKPRGGGGHVGGGGQIEEGIPYVVGNTLWAVYQFTVVIVLLSTLRARMVNTYHRIFTEADVQWKYFRACIWWKYLDKDSILPPPYTLLYMIISMSQYISSVLAKRLTKRVRGRRGEVESCGDDDVLDQARRREQEQLQLLQLDKKHFEKRYRHLMLMLICASEVKVSSTGGSSSYS